jgi:ATP-dependent Clp protease ATP-binding subunit ClpA
VYVCVFVCVCVCVRLCVVSVVRNHLRSPTFLNRLDDIVIFQAVFEYASSPMVLIDTSGIIKKFNV